MEYNACQGRYDVMPYRRCGASGVRIPEITLGLWQNFGTDAPFSRIQEMAHYAFDNGICHFDLANNYGPKPGAAEENFGKLMKSSFAPYRDELFISTKAGFLMWDGPYGEWGSRKYLLSSLDQSLKRMNLDYVDIFYSHRYDPDTPLEETMEALIQAVRQGKALYAGISNYPAYVAKDAFDYLKDAKVPCLLYQGRYNILDRRLADSGVLDITKDAKSGFICFSPLQQGLLTDRYLNGIPSDSRMASGLTSLNSAQLTEEMLSALQALNQIAVNRGQTLAQMAISWLLADERITSVLIGASSKEQLAQNLKSLENKTFSSEELAQIDAISAPVYFK